MKVSIFLLAALGLACASALTGYSGPIHLRAEVPQSTLPETPAGSLEAASGQGPLKCDCDKPCDCKDECPASCETSFVSTESKPAKGMGLTHRACGDYTEGCRQAREEGKKLITFVGHYFPCFCEDCVTCCVEKLEGYSKGDVIVSKFEDGGHYWLGTCPSHEFCPAFVKRACAKEFVKASSAPAIASGSCVNGACSTPQSLGGGNCANGQCSPAPSGFFRRR